MPLSSLLSLLAGVVGTWVGAELLVRGSARLALRLGVSPLVVGLTVVALGTSSPEAVVSFLAAAKGSGGIAVGNVLGSNIANIGLILGLTALLHPVPVVWRRLRLDYGLMLLATGLGGALLLLGRLERWGGAILILGLVLYLGWYARGSRRPPLAEKEEELEAQDGHGVPWALGQSGIGLVFLIVGARLLVGGAEVVARQLGIPEEVIGMTLVAVGTSLPELAASVVAVMRGHPDLGLGNVLGSNVMNLLFVLGGAGLIAPLEIHPQVIRLFLPITIAFAVVLWPILRIGRTVSRLEGALLVAGYLAFAIAVY